MPYLSFDRENLNLILQAANIEIDPTILTCFANALQLFHPKDIISSMGSSPTAQSHGAPPKNNEHVVEEHHEKEPIEKSESSDDDMGFGLFDWNSSKYLNRIWNSKNITNTVFNLSTSFGIYFIYRTTAYDQTQNIFSLSFWDTDMTSTTSQAEYNLNNFRLANL